MQRDELDRVRRGLDEGALRAATQRAYRELVLDALATLLRFDGAFFHALSPRVPLETGVLRGLDPSALSRSREQWDDVAVDLGAMRALADQRLVVSSDEIYPLGSARRARFERHVVRRFGMASLCMMHLPVRGSVHAALVLFARRQRAFSRAQVVALRTLAPAIAAADLVHGLLDGAARASAPIQLTCTDQRLTPRQRQIVDLVALGRSNVEIGCALGLSPYTVRNHLVRMFERLGAANRADMLRLAVLSPSA